MAKTIWVVVADEAIARVLAWPDTGDELEPVEELTDPAAHARTAELRRDAVGRRAGGAPPSAAGGVSRGRGGSSATASAGEDEQHLEAGQFARRVAQRLAECRQQRLFDELRIAAAPRFLGLLRKALPSAVTDCVTTTLDKDLIHASNADLTARLMAPVRAR